MCSGSSSHLESIHDFVLNEDKIVTYKWLSKKLKIHANTSKQLLYTFSLNNAEDGLLVTYLVSGTSEEGIKVVIVSQSDVDKVKSGFNKVLSEHVYSVQKASSQISSSQLYLADSSSQNSNNELSSISRSKVEERHLKVVPTQKIAVAASSTSLQPTTSKPLQKPTSTPSMLSGKATETKSKPDSANSKKEDASVVPAQDKKKKGAQPKGAGIGAFFNKSADKKKTEPLKESKKANTEDNSSKQVGQDSEENIDVDVEVIPDTTNLESCQKPVQKTPVYQRKNSHGKNRKRKTNKEEDNTPARKRKRIVLASDSESEEEEDVYVEEQPEEPVEVAAPAMNISESEEDEVVPPTPFGEKPKKRIRKQVDRTFVDDDGFVITKKEYVYVSCSDDENQEKCGSDETPKKVPTPKEKQPDKKNEIIKEEESKKKEIEEKSPSKAKGNKNKGDKKVGRGKAKSPKKAPPNSKQQASITSFFKRK